MPNGPALAVYLTLAATCDGAGKVELVEGEDSALSRHMLGMAPEAYAAAFEELQVDGLVVLDGDGYRLPWYEDFEDEVVEEGNREYWRRAKRKSRATKGVVEDV